MKLKDDDIRVLEGVMECAATDGETHIRELHEAVPGLTKDQIRYRIRRLREQCLVETERADEPLRTGEFPPTLVWATDEAATALSQVDSPEMTLEERVDELSKRVKRRGDTYAEMKRRFPQHDQRIEDVEKRVAELEQDLNDLIGRVTRLANVVEESEEQPEVSDADFVFE